MGGDADGVQMLFAHGAAAEAIFPPQAAEEGVIGDLPRAKGQDRTVQPGRGRGQDLDPRDPLQPGADAAGERAAARGDPLPADRLLPAQRGGQGDHAGRVARAVFVAGGARLVLEGPRQERQPPGVGARLAGRHLVEAVAPDEKDAGLVRPSEPLMAAGRERIAPEFAQLEWEHPGRLRAVDMEPGAAGAGQRGDRRRRQDDAGGRGDVADLDHAGAPRD